MKNMSNFCRILLVFAAYQLLVLPISAQEPVMILSPSEKPDGVTAGEDFTINCTLRLPEGYFIGSRLKPRRKNVVKWEHLHAGISSGPALTRNDTIITENRRISVAYFNTGINHTFQLTIANIRGSDSSLYRCYAPINHASVISATYLAQYVYISVGDSLRNRPRCLVLPDTLVLGPGIPVAPYCFVAQNQNIQKVVEWTMQYPDGSTEKINSVMTAQGVNYDSYAFILQSITRTQHDGITFTCSIKMLNVVVRTCTTDPIRVLAGPQITGNNLLGARVGDTLTVMASIELPSKYHVSETTWSKTIGSQTRQIVNNDILQDNIVNPNRYSVKIMRPEGMIMSILTVNNVQEEDTGWYSNIVSVTSDNGRMPPYMYFNFFRITVGYDLSKTIPYCETLPASPSDNYEFYMYCTVKRSNRGVQFSWVRENPDGTTDTLRDSASGSQNNGVQYNYISRYVLARNPYTDFINSVVRCTVTFSHNPDVTNYCTFRQFQP